MRRAETAAYEAIREQLLLPKDDKTDIPNIAEIAKSMVKAAIKNPNGRAAAIVAPAIGFTPDLLKRLDNDIEKQQEKDKDFLRYRVHKQFFDKQRELLLDTLIRRKILVTGRRAGKTECMAGQFCQTAVIDGSPMLYINLNFKNAIKQMWEPVLRTSEKAGLDIAHEDKTNGMIKWSNGSSLMFGGNSTTVDQEKWRGYKFRLVGIDECGSQRWLRSLVDEIVTPTLLDFEDSCLVLQGTPPRIPKTFFEQMWDSGAFKKYSWSIFENPYVPNAKEFIEELLEKRGIKIDSPLAQREYFGKIGVYDTEAMVYGGRVTYDLANGLPNIPITNIAIGVDFGYVDYNAIIPLAYNKKSGRGFVFGEKKFNKAGSEDVIKEIIASYEEAKALAIKNGLNPSMVIEIPADSSNKSEIHDLVVKHKLPARVAYKRNKEMATAQLADTLRSGRIVIPKGGALDEEMEQIVYARDEEDNLLTFLDENLGIHPDAVDAMLYAFRQYSFDTGLEIFQGDN